MAEKKVTYRLSAEGGAQVRAEFEGIGTSGQTSFEKVSRGTKSAEQSAAVFGSELDRMRAKFDPLFAASQRYEQELGELNRAHRVGAINAKTYDAALQRMNTAYARTNGLAGKAGADLARAGRAAGRARFDMRGLAMQLSQVAQSTSATGRPLQALAIQLPDIGLAFGTIGIAAGVAAGALLPLAASFLGAEDSAKAGEEAMDAFTGALSDYSRFADTARRSTGELRAEFGEMAAEIREVAKYMAEVSVGRALTALRDENLSFFGELDQAATKFGEMRDAARDLAEIQASSAASSEQILVQREAYDAYADSAIEAARALGLTAKQAGELDGAFDALRAADSMVAIRDASSAALNMIRQMFPEGQKLPPELAKAAAELETIVSESSRATANAEALASAAGGIDLSGAVGQAAALANNLGIALNAALSLQNARASKQYSGRGGDPRQFEEGGSKADYESSLDYTPVSAVIKSLTPKKRRGGGGGGRGSKDFDPLEAIRKQTEQLRQQIATLGRSEAEVAELEARWNALSEAKEKGIKISDDLKAKIEAEASVVGDLTRELESNRDRMEALEDINQTFKDSLLDAAMGGADAFDNLAEAIKRAALQYALFGEGPLAGIFGGGKGGGWKGLLGSLFSFDGGGDTPNRPRSGGLDGRGGFLAMLHPRETVIDHTRSTSSNGSMQLVSDGLTLTDNGEIMARVRLERAVALGASAREQRKALPGGMRSAQERYL